MASYASIVANQKIMEDNEILDYVSTFCHTMKDLELFAFNTNTFNHHYVKNRRVELQLKEKTHDLVENKPSTSGLIKTGDKPSNITTAQGMFIISSQI